MITAGTIDTSFVIGNGFNDLVYTTVIQPDGKILVGGNFTFYDVTNTNYITRLNTDGSIDSSFTPSILQSNIGVSFVRAIAIESDGKILVGGRFDNYNGTQTQSIIRLNTDGTPNTYFNNGFTYSLIIGGIAIVRVITVQPDGKILVGGQFDTYDGTSVGAIVRLNYDGTIDSTFNTGTGFNVNNGVFSIVVLPNGNILVGGDFNDYNGTSVNNIVLLSSTGSLLNSFGSGANVRVQKIIRLSDGKILIGGQFTEFNGTSTNYLVRLTSTGLIDTTFNFNSWVVNMVEQPDGRLLIGGQFDNYDGNTALNFIRLNPSGNVDGSFYQGSGFNDYVNSISLLQNGNILLGGKFDDYGGQSYSRLIALNNDESTYQYQYVYEAQGCNLTQGFVNVLNLPTYIIGSDVELSNGDFISIHDINSPSKIQCATITSASNIAAEPTHVYVESFNDCNSCLSANTNFALVVPCEGTIPFPEELVFIVSNQYQVGDIISIPYLIYSFEVEEPQIIYFNTCFTISQIFPFESEIFPPPQPSIIEYSPKQSCEECNSCLGRYFVECDCLSIEFEECNAIFSHQNFSIGDVILHQTGATGCKEIVYTEPIFQDTLNDFSFFSGSPVINSTVVYSSCTECLNSWTVYESFGGFVDFNPPFEGPPAWLISGSDGEVDCNEGEGLTYVYYQFQTSGTLTLDYFWSTIDECDPLCDWPFYWVSSNQPNGINNIDYTTFQFAFSLNEAGQITINYNAGDWVTIGVYSTDCCCNPGLLYITPPQTQENSSYTLHNFTTCDGQQGFVNIPSSQDSQLVDVTQIPYSEITPIGLDPMPEPGDLDDDFIEVPFPTDFSSNFLCGEYNNVYMSTNGFITFGGGYGDCCFEIPNEIPTNPALPGVYISNNSMDPVNPDCMDTYLFDWYSGVTNGGNNFVIKFVGSYYYPVVDEGCESCPPFIYSFVFYKNQPNYFDLYIESNGAFCNNNPTGGVSNGINTNFLGTFNSSSEKAYRITTTCPVIKANYGTTPAVCGTIGQSVNEIGLVTGNTIGGSMYFNGTSNTSVSVDGSGGQFGFGGNNDFTIEWFQYWLGNTFAEPVIFSIADTLIILRYETNITLKINLNTYDTGINSNSSLLLGWHHVVVTRISNVWKIYIDGVESYSFVDPADISNAGNLVIGNGFEGDRPYAGNITNFRVSNYGVYTGDFAVPSCPLTSDENTLLLMLATDAPNLILDSSPFNQATTQNNVTWSDQTPCTETTIGELYYSDVNQTYNSCEQCNQVYGVTMKECKTGEIFYLSMSMDDINSVYANGPIFADGGVECYELLDYCIIPHGNTYHPVYFYNTCESCNQPFSANTPTYICQICCPCTPGSSVKSIEPPHPVWTNQRGKAVVQLNMVTLGGENGLNS